MHETKGFDKKAFVQLHISDEQITSVRINPAKFSKFNSQFSIDNKVPWTEFGYYLNSRPSFTFDPFFHAGCYYVQEASSMFLEQALKQTIDLSKPVKVLDLCAAPGGKSTHIQSLILKESLLVSNEVIRSRANILKDNIIKWGCENVVVTNNDPKDFSKLENYFDVIVVDAPCSGSGLFRRDPEAIGEWSENNVHLCSQRQQRILADILPALKRKGILIYSTCSYSMQEDEEITDWLKNKFSLSSCSLSLDSNWGIIESSGGYRFWPDKVKGEGFFTACFQKADGDTEVIFRAKRKPEQLTKRETEIAEKWLRTEGKGLIRNQNTVYAWPEDLVADFSYLLEQLRVMYSGVLVGELMRDKLVPDHALAMSKCTAEAVNRVELSGEDAIKYLQRKDLRLEVSEKGWCLAAYEGKLLGWLNILPNRVNNYYPKEQRILKDN